MNQEEVLSLVRHVLTFVGGILVTKGLIDETTMVQIIGFVMTVAGTIWGWFNKRQHAKKVAVFQETNQRLNDVLTERTKTLSSIETTHSEAVSSLKETHLSELEAIKEDHVAEVKKLKTTAKNLRAKVKEMKEANN